MCATVEEVWQHSVNREVTQMGESNIGSKVSYFMVGLGIGALIGILFAPKSGEETREFLSKKADEGKDFAQRKARELRERADDLIERGKDVASRQRESISAAVDAGREAYQREKGKAQ
jgi:gas vesicle protein